MTRGLVLAVPNFSEGRRREVIEHIVDAVRNAPGVRLLDYSSDMAMNRTVVSVAGPPAEFAAGVRVYIPAATAWLSRDKTGFYAISAVCPHLGCTIQQAETGFECPCHGSRFSDGGAVLNGPATRSMTWLAVSLVDGQLVIDRTRTVPAETRLEV